MVVSWEQNTTSVKRIVAMFGDYTLLFDNTALVKTASRSSEIRDALKQALTDDAQIYVSKLDVSNISTKAFYRNGQE